MYRVHEQYWTSKILNKWLLHPKTGSQYIFSYIILIPTCIVYGNAPKPSYTYRTRYNLHFIYTSILHLELICVSLSIDCKGIDTIIGLLIEIEQVNNCWIELNVWTCERGRFECCTSIAVAVHSTHLARSIEGSSTNSQYFF